MKKENILVISLIIIALVGTVMYNRVKSAPFSTAANSATTESVDGYLIGWQEFEAGKKKAESLNKPVFLYFYADWCTYCKKLKQTTFKDEDVLKYLDDNFISIKVNTDFDKELADTWKVRGLPTSWFLKPDSSQIDSVPGYIDSDQFLAILKYIKTNSYEKMSFSKFMETL